MNAMTPLDPKYLKGLALVGLAALVGMGNAPDAPMGWVQGGVMAILVIVALVVVNRRSGPQYPRSQARKVRW